MKGGDGVRVQGEEKEKKNKQKKVYGRLRCYAGAARRKPYPVPASTKWPHFTHLTQMTSRECKQFLTIIFHAFQNFSTLTPDIRWYG